MKPVWMIAAALTAAPMATAAGTIVNGGFETGDFTDWSLIGEPDAFVLPQFVHHRPSGDTTYMPVEGDHLADISARMFQTETPEGIFQELDLNGAQKLSGSAALLANFLDGYNVEGFVRLVDSQNHAFSLFHAQTNGLGDFGETPWINFSAIPAAGHYRLEALTLDHTLDAQQSANLLVDAFSVTSVPEPATWTVLLAGFALAGASLRAVRRRAVRE